MTTVIKGSVVDLALSSTERFWSFVKRAGEDNCWEWIGSRRPNGYGRLKIRKRWFSAHRLSWMIEHKEDPGLGYICHHCDNKACVNPSHLFLGDAITNRRDCVEKLRHAFGASNGGGGKLTEEQVIEIFNSGDHETYTEAAKHYGVSAVLISRIRRGLSWARITNRLAA